VIEAQHRIFNFAIACVSRVLILRDWVFGWVVRNRSGDPALGSVSRQSIPSGSKTLDAVLVTPAPGGARASVLLCHGIGETVEHWLGVQRLLAAHGVASLVFDYSGYGRSPGPFSAGQAEQDAVCAFRHLQGLTAPLPVCLLGFSLGSGIAVAIVQKVPAHRLILGAAFTSLRKAAVSTGVPSAFAFTVPDIWDADSALRACTIPVLIVHGERDQLFPVSMAKELQSLCGPNAELVVVPKVAHNQPFRRPELSYWGEMIDWLLPGKGDQPTIPDH
jgi:hypothetical protein